MKISRIKIEKIQAQKKLTQREIATLLGCSPNFICMIWRGKNISAKDARKNC